MSETRWSLMPEEENTNLRSIKLVMLNVIITHVKQNDHLTRDTDTTSLACGHLIFLITAVQTDWLAA